MEAAEDLEEGEGPVDLVYCTREWSSVRAAIVGALREGSPHILIVPLVFAVDVLYREDVALSELKVRIANLARLHPQTEILYIGPPFDHEHQLRLVFDKIRDYEAGSIDVLEDVVERGFKGDWMLFTRFMETLQSALPLDTRVGLRGSVVTGQRWLDERAFDADGEGTSDLDLVLVGEDVMDEWEAEAFYIPEVGTMPLSDKSPEIAPGLNPVRVQLQKLVARPVNIQAMTRWFLDLRYRILGQPYLLLN